MGPRPTKGDEDESGADPLVRAGPLGPALPASSIFSPSRRGRRLRTRGVRPTYVFNGAFRQVSWYCSLAVAVRLLFLALQHPLLHRFLITRR
jgi:hypothetical protein